MFVHPGQRLVVTITIKRKGRFETWLMFWLHCISQCALSSHHLHGPVLFMQCFSSEMIGSNIESIWSTDAMHQWCMQWCQIYIIFCLLPQPIKQQICRVQTLEGGRCKPLLVIYRPRNPLLRPHQPSKQALLGRPRCVFYCPLNTPLFPPTGLTL